MKINEPWEITYIPGLGRRVACINCDDGCYIEMDGKRARRLVALWNANLGVPISKIKKFGK